MSNQSYTTYLSPAIGSLLVATIAGVVLLQFLPAEMVLISSLIISLVMQTLLYIRLVMTPLQQAFASLSNTVVSGKIDEQASRSITHPLYQKSIESLQAVAKLRVQLSESGSRIAIAAAEVSFSSDSLEQKVHEEVAETNVIAESINRITLTMDEMAQMTGNASHSAQQSHDVSNQGRQATQKTAAQMQSTKQHAEQTAEIISGLEIKSNQILEVSNVISDIAEQTNLLALNAAIEAARAGEQGRGFAVVADEVRSLAQRTAESTSEIKQTVNEIYSQVGAAAGNMRELMDSINSSAHSTSEVNNLLENILQQSESVSKEISGISQGAEENAAEVEQISGAISTVTTHLNETEQQVEGIAQQSLKLAEMAEFIHDAMSGFDLGTVHDQMRKIASDAATIISQTFEQAIANNQITLDDLFDRDYKEIAGSNPAKYTTRFDSFTDKVLPDIQEPILQQHGEIAYAGAVDDKGYFPTHNKKFSQPLTGDYQTDLVNNRTKRIFTDRVGSRCGAHTRKFLLQTYKRDTGEVLHDISVPIYINGKHWGGFRMGYKAEH
ncbi:MAG: methyl-accepting chemotaxis protein [Gammaproteobacteria bacterium]|nr:methyl-accepting chemotaxis protein [Gammaproteobacteria bacterium]